jgi:hypothetical protein
VIDGRTKNLTGAESSLAGQKEDPRVGDVGGFTSSGHLYIEAFSPSSPLLFFLFLFLLSLASSPFNSVHLLVSNQK